MFLIMLLLLVFSFSGCGESTYSWAPEEKASESEISDAPSSSTIDDKSTSIESANDNAQTTTSTKPITTSSSTTPLSDEEEQQLKSEMDKLIDELMEQ